MNLSKQLFWKLCFIFGTGIFALFYFINQLTSKTEEGMSFIDEAHRQTIVAWGAEAQRLYESNDRQALDDWLSALQERENTWASVVSYDFVRHGGGQLKPGFFDGYNLGRSVDWKIHLYFAENPTMEVPFFGKQTSFVITLPDYMRPGDNLRQTQVVMQIIIPTFLLALIFYLLYRYIMKPLLQLQAATRNFSAGHLDVSASQLMGKRNDEFSDLAQTFDQMAARIGDQIISQRQLIEDLSHELRTPLTRLDIAVSELAKQCPSENTLRIERESHHIRKLVEDSLTLAWLENEKPELRRESLELVDLLDVLIEDARYEFPDRQLICNFPNNATIENSCHRAAGQAIENILRNALRYTPKGKQVTVDLKEQDSFFRIAISDQGIGVPEQLLEKIFIPFFRVDKSRERDGSSFGLGLALAVRQLVAISASVSARNLDSGGLTMEIIFPKA